MSAPAEAADPRATRLLRSAHETLYRWPDGFAGFRAAVVVEAESAIVRGDIDVLAGHGAAFTPDREHEVNPVVAAEVVELATRLAPRPFATLDGRFGGSFRRDLDRDASRAVEVVGDPRRTVRWISRDRLVETVYQQPDGHRRVVVLEAHELEDGRWLPRCTGEDLVAGDTTVRRRVTEEWTALDGLVLPSRRTIVIDGARSIDIRLGDHVLVGTR